MSTRTENKLRIAQTAISMAIDKLLEEKTIWRININDHSKEMFGSLELDKKIVTALTDMGFEEPSPIQAATIPLVLEGNDVIGQAQTGTGKTAASVFLWCRQLPTSSIFRR